jgi:hypothetical protein
MSLRLRARKGLRSGRLPRRPLQRMWAGPGSDKTCLVCEEAIRPDQVELELEHRSARGGESSPENARVHVPCLTAWQDESRFRTAKHDLPAEGSDGRMAVRGLPFGRGSA